jgi:hypothetical protein
MDRRCTICLFVIAMLTGCAATPPSAPATSSPLQPVFCYRTLADVDCYTQADPGRESRLTAIYLRAAGPWRTVYRSTPRGEAGAAAGPLPLFPVNP